jgi:putative copper export protein
MKTAVTIFIGFTHDLATGIWAAALLSLYWLDRISDESLKPALTALEREFFYIGLVCIGIVLLTGAGRTFTYAYIGEVYGGDAEKIRRKMLIIKHVVLLLVFSVGTYWQYTMAFN